MNGAGAGRSWGKFGLLPVLGLMALLGAAPAAAQNADLRQLLDRIDRLERDIRTLNVQLARGGQLPPTAPGVTGSAEPPGGAAVARIDARLGAFDEELRALTGLAETLSHRIDQIDDRLNKLVGDVDFRLGALERAAAQAARPAKPGVPSVSAAPSTSAVQTMRPDDGQGFATAPQTLGTIPQSDLGRPAAPPGVQAPAAPPAVEAAAVLPEGTPKEQYEFAKNLLFRQEYDQAETVLRAFLGAHPNDVLASNAQYWLGETYYVRQDYDTAAIVFTEGYKKYKDGAKAPDSLLKLAMSLSSSEKREAACFTLAELDKVFPDAQRHIKDEAARQRQHNGCK
ncbi:MAG: tol-pal system protein YbgF [Rhodospirillales bacterium]|nr:tol-pal system protein YbgF [Rhodospirillales bacterium]